MTIPPAPPPPQPPLGGPVPQKMPGSTKGAVVLLWILFGLGICGGAASLVGFAGLSALEDSGDVVIPDSFMPIMIANIVQLVIWTVLRGVFAVKIAGRADWARKGAMILEGLGILLAIVWWVVTPEIEITGAATSTAQSTASTIVSALIGIALAAIIIFLLNTQDSKRWCNE